MSIRLSARVKKIGQSNTGLSLGIAFGGGWHCIVLWDDGSLSAEQIETLKVNPVDVALIDQELTDTNEALIRESREGGDH